MDKLPRSLIAATQVVSFCLLRREIRITQQRLAELGLMASEERDRLRSMLADMEAVSEATLSRAKDLYENTAYHGG